jgi:hypothetical protein
LCTIRGGTLYLNGMRAGRGRAGTITTDEFINAIDAVDATEIDGLCIFTCTDLLDMRETVDGRRRIERLMAFRR